MSKEIDIKLETVEVKGGKSIPLTVRNVFYKGFWGKLTTIVNWFLRGEMKLQEYLDSPVTYERVLPEHIDTFHGIDAEAELTRILKEEVENEILKKYNGEVERLITDLPNLTYKETIERSGELWKLVPFNMDINPVGLNAAIHERFKDNPEYKERQEKNTFRVNVGELSDEQAKDYIKMVANRFKKGEDE